MFGVGVGLNTGGAFGAASSGTGVGTGLFGAPTSTISSATPTGGGSLFGNTLAQTPNTFGSPTNAALNEPTSHGIVYQEKLEKNTSTHGKVVTFINQLTDRVTPPFRYRCNDYLNPNGRPNAGAMNNLGGLFGQSAAATTGNQTAGGGLFGNTAATQSGTATGGGLFGNAQGGGLFGQQTNTGGGLFGNSSPTQPQASTGLFGATSVVQQQPTQNSFFGNNTNTSTLGSGLLGTNTAQPSGGGGLFGSTQPSGGGLFGSTQSNLMGTGGGGLFGNTNTVGATNTATTTTQPNTGLFGTTTNPTTNTLGGGLFGNTSTLNTTQPATGSSLFGNTTNTGGLFGATNTNTGGGLFGSAQPAAPAATTGLFGQTAQTNTGGGLFGGTSNTGLFGATTPTQPAAQTGGLFGSTATTTAPTTTSLFGAPAATTNTLGTGGLFGSPQTQTNTGGLFGNTTTTAPVTSGGLFGNTTTSTLGTGGLFGSATNTVPNTSTGGLFGNTSSPQPANTGGLFGAATTNQPTLGTTGGGLFGNTAPSTGGLFGSTTATTAQPGLSGGLFGSTAATTQPTLGGGLFGNTANTGLSSGLNSLTSTNTGLFGQKPAAPAQLGGSVFGLNSQTAPIGTVPATVNPPLGTVMKDDPYNMSSIAITNAASLLYGSTAQTLPFQPFAACKNVYRSARANKTSYLSSYLREPANTVNDSAARQREQPQLLGSASSDVNPITESDDVNPRNRRRKPSAQEGLFVPVEGNVPLISGTLTNWNTSDTNKFSGASQQMKELPAVVPSKTNADHDPPDLPILTRVDYACRPSLESMSTYSDEKLAQVEDLTITREGYGSITWPGCTDVRGLNFDAIVQIESRAVEVYGRTWQEIVKQSTNEVPTPPPVGQGLNKRAIITLENCGSSKLLKSKDNDQFESHKKRLCDYTENEMKAKFISLSRDYTWKFRVEHFSRYAYPDLDPGSAVKKPIKRRGNNRKDSLMIRRVAKPSSIRDTCKTAAEQTSSAIQQTRGPLVGDLPNRKLKCEDLWTILEASRVAGGGEVRAYSPPSVGVPFEVRWLNDILKPADKRLDPRAIGRCLRNIPAEPRTAYGQLELVSAVWSAELDVLGGVVQWLVSQNANAGQTVDADESTEDHANTIIDLLLANRVRDASMYCLSRWRKPRLALLISAAGCPNLSAQPRIAEQLVAYRKQQLGIKDNEVRKLMFLLSGTLPVDGEDSISYKSWKQALASILIFGMNANLIRFHYPTFADQLRLLRCALDKVPTVYLSETDWKSESEWKALCFLVSHGLSTANFDVESQPRSAEASPIVPPSELDHIGVVQSAASQYENDQSSLAAVCRWLLILYNVYNDDPERSLVQILQSTAPWIPNSLDRDQSTLVWSLIRYQQTRNKNFLTRQIYSEYTSKNHPETVKKAQPIDDSPPPAHRVIDESSSILSGDFLPQWFVYQCVGEEFQRRKMNLQAATAYLQAYKASLKLHGEVATTDSGWWAVLQEQLFGKDKGSIPDESEFMTLILQSLVNDKYLANTKATILEALKPPLTPPPKKTAGVFNVQLIDMLVDLRLIQLVETVDSYKRGLDLAQLANRELQLYEQRFLTLWKENDLDCLSDILDGLQRFVETVIVSEWDGISDLAPLSKSDRRHTLVVRTLNNLKNVEPFDGVNEPVGFEVDKYLASLF